MEYALKAINDPSARVVRLVTRRNFIDEGLVFLNDFEQTVLSLSQGQMNEETALWLTHSMAHFSQVAALHQLEEASELANELVRVFNNSKNSNTSVSPHRLFLVQAALSQLRLMLSPSIDGAGENALRIMTGLMKQL
ncbi:MAG: hypothetical protein HQL67_10980 [Magnetococcales bacterium]|nr:hypothetical protein [Magnetococcales bacterium]